MPSDLGTMQVTHLSAPRGAFVFPVSLAECIPHRHLNVHLSSAFMECNSLNIVNPLFKWTPVELSFFNL